MAVTFRQLFPQLLQMLDQTRNAAPRGAGLDQLSEWWKLIRRCPSEKVLKVHYLQRQFIGPAELILRFGQLVHLALVDLEDHCRDFNRNTPHAFGSALENS